MSLFDLQDVCIAIGSLATLDLPMVVDLIGIYVLKGPYCTLTTTNWFLQALSVIPRGSWGDVSRSIPVVDRIGGSTAAYSLKCRFPRETGRSQAPRRQQGSRTPQNPPQVLNTLSLVSVRESRIQYLCDPQWFRDTASLGPTTIVAPESQFRTCPSDHDSIGYPRMSASGESSTTMHRLLHASGSHPIPAPNDPKTNQYNQDLRLIHSTNGNHLESPNEGSSIDHQVTIYLHAQNITMFPTNETWNFASQILVSGSGDLILILTAQSTRNVFRIHSDY
ncbi:hypothetical protein F511_19212 [Dorcoceras hygrometricum]|uniref:Uncharacterized protein n=1 Tax=Dorcoceras hygrometricum TaxID=472368 RepID=A0A2Z7C3L3_9LAMI|nr:hypothetical protein F511_19212 [Dorcoceras hygrometricum]